MRESSPKWVLRGQPLWRRRVGRDVVHEFLESVLESLGGLTLRVDIPREIVKNLQRGVCATVPEKGFRATQVSTVIRMAM